MMNCKIKYKLRKNKRKIIKISGIILCIMILGILIFFLSYARFESHNEYSLLNGKVEDFSYDVSLVGYIYDGEKHDVPPSKENNYIVSDVKCDNATGTWNNESWSLSVSDITGKVKCKISFEKIVYTEITPKDLKRGDKVKITLTGNEGTATDWMVLNEGENPEIYNISELNYTISPSQQAYLDYIYNLNTEAKSYIDSKYVVSARSFGYNNQIEKCSNLESCVEEKPYQADLDAMEQLGNNVYSRWMASRIILGKVYYGGVYNQFGTIQSHCILYRSFASDKNSTNSLMPVLKLRSDIKIIRNEYTKDCVVQQ